ncbi:MAG: hypothetical protein JWQ18_1336 [Conexibacter sp.]|nr:hypothetical protein [Conexibacter sp.]
MDDLREAWERDGYVVLRGASPTDLIAAYDAELAADREGLLVRGPGDEHVSLATQDADRPTGAVDPYALSPAARALLLPPELVRFLARDVFDREPPLLFDAAEATAGAPDPDGGPYRDATFTALAAEPESLVTATVALGEDAQVTLYPGSQRITTTPFSGRHRAFNPERDGAQALARHRDELATALTGDPETITLHAGDALLWSAGLVHTAVAGTALVAHLCPVRVQPAWFAYRPERARLAAHEDGAAWIASQHYDLLDAVAPEDEPPAGVEAAPELERVEEALREHDEDNPPAPSPPPSVAGRRSGGLVDSVRGLMNRRGRGR